MKGKRCRQESKVYTLEQVGRERRCRRCAASLGSVATLYRWQRTLGRMGLSELNELRILRDENQRLKRLAADLTLDKHSLQEVVAKSLKPSP